MTEVSLFYTSLDRIVFASYYEVFLTICFIQVLILLGHTARVAERP